VSRNKQRIERSISDATHRRRSCFTKCALHSALDKYQFIDFEPTAIVGLPDTVDIGQPFEFSVTGELSIRGVTQTETFYMVVTATSGDELSGHGSTSVLYSDYGIVSPSVPAISGVVDEVRLEVEFVATAC
jgi:polyisoprenoid-binding protein YceI